jgi:two-component system chemotaxis response regulator CheB
MQMPVMSGLSATEYIMAHCPTPILIVSASTNRGELYKTYDALAAGAVDVLEKPRGDASDDDWDRRFVAAVRLVARIRVITHPRARLGLATRAPSPRAIPAAPHPASTGPFSVVALGASTGGPSALVQVLRALPRHLPLTILLVLHIDEPFGSAFGEWLGEQASHRVRFVTEGEPLYSKQCRVLMAPPGRHLVVVGQRLALNDEPERHSCRPSIDVLFESLARGAGRQTAAALLTGMGKDGALGLLALRHAGALTVAQDEETSVVWGMPREAAALGAASHILALSEIGPFLAEAVGSRASERP